ncbi:MAG: hypothetical protein K2M15_09520 [Oscillospiraceae bacterium]|nr:hypothetical protein [Oscillospiraceae bacterium]
MKSVTYTFITWNGGQRAAGFDGALDSGRQVVMVRQSGRQGRTPGGNNVIDLTAWRAATQELWEEQSELEPEYNLEEAGPETPVRRARSRRWRAHVDPELLAILSVVGVLAALVVRVLAF